MSKTKPYLLKDKFLFSPVERLSSSRIVIDGKPFTDFTSFDYFNFYQDQRIKENLFKAGQLSGLVTPSPRSHGGTHEEHVSLELALSRTFQQSSALYLSSRHQAILTLITGLVSESDIVIYDEDTSAPIVDACYLVGAASYPVDMLSFDWTNSISKIVANAHKGSKIFLFVEELSSTTGQMIHLTETLNHLKFLGVTLILDVTFSLGLRTYEFNDDDVIIVGGFGYSLPGVGGFICGDKRIDFVKNKSKVLTSEAPLPSYLATFSRLSLNLLPELSLKITLILEKVLEFQQGAKKASGLKFLGISSGISPSTPVIAIQFLNEEIARALYTKLSDNGIFATRIARGSVMSSRSIIRFNFSQTHTIKEIENLVRLFFE
jgi:8-amino-7-oxononanoate synthase